MDKPRVAIFDFAGCEGCQLQIVNMETEILDLLGTIELVEWREGMTEHSDDYDIAIVEGSITRPEDEERLRKIRERATVLIALGSCAVGGGVNKLKNLLDSKEAARVVYGEHADAPHLQGGTVKSLSEVVTVDYNIYGCPIDRVEFTHIVRSLLLGRQPYVPEYSVCVECKQKGNACQYDSGQICLGPLTRAGCNARCPSYGFWCYGCRGLMEEPNLEATAFIMKRYGRTVEELEERLALFGTV